MIRFRSFQSRIAFFFLGLVAIVQVLVFFAIDVITTRHAREQIETALAAGAGNFQRTMELRTFQLQESVRILASDFAFKTAIATGDVATARSALANQGSRVGADAMILVSLDHRVAVDTRPASGVYPPSLGELVHTAERHGQAAAVVVLDGRPHQLVVQPVLAPDPIAWLVAGFALDDGFARSVEQLLRLDVSFFEVNPGGGVLLASSLAPAQQSLLARMLPTSVPTERVIATRLGGADVLDFAKRVGTQGGSSIYVLLQRSLDDELRPFQEARNVVAALSVAGLVLSLIGAFFVARTVTRPVQALVESARSAERGDYTRTVQLNQRDEIGELAAAFNRMLKGLTERDRVRDLLGLFVSPAVAEHALAGDARLGGELREVTVLFADLRDFTALAERRAPEEVVSLLNQYFTRMNEVVERHHGLIDKFLGDGLMALFGAPLTTADDAGNALQAAIEMVAALEALNAEVAERGLPRLDVGIGINTATVVAGNMGSPNRLNYTVVGDGVNLAARIEGLTKRAEFGARIIATDAAIRAAKRDVPARPLGLVKVRGRQEPAVLHAVLVPGTALAGTKPAARVERHAG
jgi:adenylate cyclase